MGKRPEMWANLWAKEAEASVGSKRAANEAMFCAAFSAHCGPNCDDSSHQHRFGIHSFVYERRRPFNENGGGAAGDPLGCLPVDRRGARCVLGAYAPLARARRRV